MGRIVGKRGHILKPNITYRGYHALIIRFNGVVKTTTVHRCVASAFLGDITGKEVDHLDFDKSNNRLDNLEIVSRAENMKRFHESDRSFEVYQKIGAARIIRLSEKRKQGVHSKSDESKKSEVPSVSDEEWKEVWKQYKAMQEIHGMSEVWMSQCFGYKSPQGFRNATRYKKIITGAVRLWLKTQKS